MRPKATPVSRSVVAVPIIRLPKRRARLRRPASWNCGAIGVSALKRIRNELIRLDKLELSAVTIHRVLGGWHGVSVLSPRKRVRHKSKRYNRPVPGDRVQMDTFQIRPGLYQFTAIDDCSRFLAAGLAKHRWPPGTLAFLDRVLEETPFAIQRLQTDRGTEFFAEAVLLRLRAEAIRFRPIRPRSPHLNGAIERVQRTMLEEFWASHRTHGQRTANSSSRYGFTTTIATGRVNPSEGWRRLNACARWSTRHHSGPTSAPPTIPITSGSG